MTGKEPEVVAPIITNGYCIFKLSGESLYGGKGKHSYTVLEVPCIKVSSDGDPDAQSYEQRPPTGNTFESTRATMITGNTGCHLWREQDYNEKRK